MAANTQEIEQKFLLADGAELPSLDGLDGVAAVSEPVEQHLRATYYDTIDLRLASSGLALRRRTGGGDEGWHLKESVAADERLETHAPLGAGTEGVPEPMAELVRSRARKLDLLPIATLDTRRVVRHLIGDDGSVLAEVADDTVAATANAPGAPASTAWREVEIELVKGDREVLAAAAQRLVDAGAKVPEWGSKLAHALGDAAPTRAAPIALRPDSSTGEVVTAYLAEQVQALVSLDPRVRRDEPDTVHKMRVATRRLRSALATFRRLLDRAVTEPIRDELKWLAGILGAARDAEVIHARLEQSVADEPPGLVAGPIAERIDATMRARYKEAHREVLSALDSDRYLALLDALDQVATGAVVGGDRAARKAARGLPREVGRSLRRWHREVDALESAGDEDTAGHGQSERDLHLHEVRKAAKRVRYAGEAVEPVIGRPAERLAERMENLQEVLGLHQDGIVTGRVIARLADDARAAGEDTFTYGRLHAAEQQRSERAAGDGRALIDELAATNPAWLR